MVGIWLLGINKVGTAPPSLRGCLLNSTVDSGLLVKDARLLSMLLEDGVHAEAGV